MDDDHIYIGYSQTTYGQIRDAARARKSLSTFDPRRINVYDWDGNSSADWYWICLSGRWWLSANRLVAASVNPETAEEIIVSYPLH